MYLTNYDEIHEIEGGLCQERAQSYLTQFRYIIGSS